jgi:hypothetical protein
MPTTDKYKVTKEEQELFNIINKSDIDLEDRFYADKGTEKSIARMLEKGLTATQAKEAAFILCAQEDLRVITKAPTLMKEADLKMFKECLKVIKEEAICMDLIEDEEEAAMIAEIDAEIAEEDKAKAATGGVA